MSGTAKTSIDRLTGWARRATALLALVGLLVHAGLPLLHAPRAAAAELDSTVVICTGFGVKVVQLAELEGEHGQKQQARIYYCPLCLAQQMAVAAILPDPIVIAAPAIAGTVQFRLPPAPILAPEPYAHAQARAPPSIA